MRTASWTAIAFLALILAAPAAADFIGQSDQEVQAAAEPILDAMLKGYNEGDYGLYAKSFDDTLKDTMSEKRFKEVRGRLLTLLGRYQSRTYLGHLKKGQTTMVLWKATFDRTADQVLIKLVASRRGNKDQVVGLWFQ